MRLILPLITGVVLASACSVEEVLQVDPVATAEVVAPYSAISPGEIHHFRVLLRDVDGSDLGPRETSWRSLDPGIASVDDTGRVTGIAVGTARIVASSEGRADTLTIPVRASWKGVWAANRLVCAERTAGGTWCWGDVPGDGSTGTSYSPVALAGGLTLRGIVEDDATCGLAPNGSYYCWDGKGYLPDEYGNGSDSTHGPTPTLGASGIKLKGFGAYFAGGTCGAGLDGTGLCWGGPIPWGVDTSIAFNYPSAPATVLGGVNWRTLQSGEYGVCGLSTSGIPYCFGHAYAILGQGNPAVARKLPTPVVGGHTFDSLFVNGRSACALKSNGEAWCWGEGAIGNGGGYAQYGTPALVVGGHQFKVIRKGDGAAYCGVDLQGAIWCWGAEPVRVEAPFPFVDIAAGSNLCGLTAGGGVYCRGPVLLGDGSKGPSDAFVRVTDPA